MKEKTLQISEIGSIINHSMWSGMETKYWHLKKKQLLRLYSLGLRTTCLVGKEIHNHILSYNYNTLLMVIIIRNYRTLQANW